MHPCNTVSSILTNVVLDIYRPRVQGQYSRSAFDSRLLGVINEPGGIVHTFASMIDYQFGFKVSETWFYKLLGKAIVPLVLLAVITLYALSSVVVVAPGSEAIIEHFGSLEDGGRKIGPGIAFKLPWPFDIAYKYPTGQIQQVNTGFVEDPQDRLLGKPLLWGQEHYKEEFNLLIATGTEDSGDQQGAVAVSIVNAAVPVQYVVEDLQAFLYSHADAGKMLETICYRELTKFAASATIDTDGPDAERSLLGAGRRAAADELTRNIQAGADKEGLGVRIIFVGLQGVHPPKDVAKEYGDVIGAVQLKQASILRAEAERNKILTLLCGSIELADRLYELAEKYEKAPQGSEEKTQLEAKLKQAFSQSSGEIFKTLSDAQKYAFNRAKMAQGTGKQFAGQVKAYRASPEIYKQQQRLAMLEETLSEIRKYVLVSDADADKVFILDLKEKLPTGLMGMDVPGTE